MTFRHQLLADNDLMVVMAELYDSEINCSLSSFWDGGWTVHIGDEINGYSAERSFDSCHLHQAGEWLAKEAVERFPDSKFALLYNAARSP